jgi:hypothetical protein
VVKPRGKVASLCAALNAARARYVLAGAQAGILWGHVRATRDIDVLIEPTEANARAVLDVLDSVGFVLTRDLDAKEVAASHVTVIGDLWHVDLLTRAWNVRFTEAAADAQVFAAEGVSIPTLSLAHLIASKRTGRLQDAADIEVLEKIQRLLGAT